MHTPVAFLIFRRPLTTRRVFAEIARARPPVLLVVADGPRTDADRAACADTRAIIDGVDWPCDVRRCYADTNLGCRRRVSSGLDWVFREVEEAIILEDDTVPHPDFFRFCDALLTQYRDDPRVGHIAGTDTNRGPPRGTGSYYASRYPSIWGWATWRRCWQDYDADLAAWPRIKAEGRHRRFFSTAAEARHFAALWDDIRAGTLDTWDVQWMFCRLLQGTLALTPNGNLITNVGFDQDATHTRDRGHPFAGLPTHAMAFPLRAPAALTADDEADRQRARAEFLRSPPRLRRLMDHVSNKHLYGQWLRRLPLVGPAWAAWRTRRGPALSSTSSSRRKDTHP